MGSRASKTGESGATNREPRLGSSLDRAHTQAQQIPSFLKSPAPYFRRRPEWSTLVHRARGPLPMSTAVLPDIASPRTGAPRKLAHWIGGKAVAGAPGRTPHL